MFLPLILLLNNSSKIVKLSGNPPMNRNKVFELLPAVIDNEVSEAEKAAFLIFIRNHPDIRKEYKESLEIKRLLSQNLRRYKAPARLRDAIRRLIDEMDREE